jgi:hypothetical protein
MYLSTSRAAGIMLSTNFSRSIASPIHASQPAFKPKNSILLAYLQCKAAVMHAIAHLHICSSSFRFPPGGAATPIISDPSRQISACECGTLEPNLPPRRELANCLQKDASFGWFYMSNTILPLNSI